VPAVAAGLTVGGAVGLAEASEGRGGHEGAPEGPTAQGGSGGVEGFVLVGVSEEPVVAFEKMFHGFPEGPMPVRPTFSLRSYVVECAYPVGSKAWMAIGDRDEDGSVVVYDARDPDYVYVRPEGTRRVLFPRFVAEEGEDLRGRARSVYNAVRENGFDTASGPEHAWMVVHVEYRCPDGVEHVMAGMPLSWDPRLALGVMVRGQIG
jgi:hypothetical protein